MITLDDWSELVTIDYNGGMGGEFFGLLLHDAIYKNTVYKLTAFNNKYDFKKYDVFTSYEDNNNRNQTVLKKLYYLKRKFYNENDKNNEYEDHYLINLYNKIFVNKLNFSEEYRNFVYENYSYRFDGGLKIALFHDNHSHNLNKKYNISLPHIFPKSKNIMFVCPDHYMFFSKFLMVIKVITQHSKVKNKEKLRNFIDSQYDKFTDFDFYIFDDYPCLKLDIYSFLYEQKNYDRQLSDLLEQDVVLNREKTNEYAQKNIELFNQYGLDISNVYSKDYFRNKLNYFMKSF